MITSQQLKDDNSASRKLLKMVMASTSLNLTEISKKISFDRSYVTQIHNGRREGGSKFTAAIRRLIEETEKAAKINSHQIADVSEDAIKWNLPEGAIIDEMSLQISRLKSSPPIRKMFMLDALDSMSRVLRAKLQKSLENNK